MRRFTGNIPDANVKYIVTQSNSLRAVKKTRTYIYFECSSLGIERVSVIVFSYAGLQAPCQVGTVFYVNG